ncbi:hypothetical protein CB1_001340005 [Camelus ferus]|nr:hypothetical protein CB1_001340005 [Camelus ferus]
MGSALDAVANHRPRRVTAANLKGQGHKDEHLAAPSSLFEVGLFGVTNQVCPQQPLGMTRSSGFKEVLNKQCRGAADVSQDQCYVAFPRAAAVLPPHSYTQQDFSSSRRPGHRTPPLRTGRARAKARIPASISGGPRQTAARSVCVSGPAGRLAARVLRRSRLSASADVSTAEQERP